MKLFAMVAMTFALVGCGGSSSPSTCHLDAQVSGAATWSYDNDPVCSIPFGPTSGITMEWLPIGDAVSLFHAEVDDVMEGQTGMFPAYVEVKLRAGGIYRTPKTCTVTISEHVLEGHEDGPPATTLYRASGSGTCTDKAAPTTTATGELTIAPFTFTFPARW